jgi:hypothetical protein
MQANQNSNAGRRAGRGNQGDQALDRTKDKDGTEEKEERTSKRPNPHF